MKDKWKTGVNSCGPRHPELDASPETEAKSCGPVMQPFERSKNPIQANLFGEQDQIRPDQTDIHTQHIHTHAYIRTYMHAYLHTYMHACIHSYILTYLHAYILTYLHPYMLTCLHTYILTYLHACIHTYIHAYIHTCIHACIHTYIHIYIHTYMYMCFLVFGGCQTEKSTNAPEYSGIHDIFFGPRP